MKCTEALELESLELVVEYLLKIQELIEQPKLTLMQL